jgi:glyoxylate carboligase
MGGFGVGVERLADGVSAILNTNMRKEGRCGSRRLWRDTKTKEKKKRERESMLEDKSPRYIDRVTKEMREKRTLRCVLLQVPYTQSAASECMYSTKMDAWPKHLACKPSETTHDTNTK